MRLDPTGAEDAALVVAVRQKWHPRAWLAYASTGEVKGGARFMENACSRVNLLLGIRPAVGEDAVPVKDAIERGLVSGASGSPGIDVAVESSVTNLATLTIAEQITEQMIDGQESDGALLAGWGNKSFVVGECYVVGYMNPLTLAEEWLVLSAGELQVNEQARPGDSRFKVQRTPATTSGAQTSSKTSGVTAIVLPADAVIIRVWRRDAEWGDLSDSNLRACLTECEELGILSASIKAQGMSRIPANILYVADEIKPFVTTVGGNSEPETVEGGEPQLHPFLKDMIEHMTTPVRDPSSVSSTVPFLMTGPGEVNGVSARDMIFMVEVGRPLDPQVVERCRYLIERIANTVDLPSERLTGMGGANHWTAWQIDEETYRLYVAPTVDVMVSALTRKYLRSRLILSGVPREEANRYTYIADPGDLVAKPNRAENARIAHEALAINDQALRDALGFGDEDEPTPEEIVRRIVQRQTVLPADLIPLLNQILGTNYETPPAPATPGDGGGTPNVAEQPEPGPGQEGPVGTPGGAPNDGQPSDASVTAAAGRGRNSATRRLMSIDRRLRSRLLAYSEASVERAVERAGARLRTSLANARAGTPKADARALLASVPNRRVTATIGRERMAALGIEEDALMDAEIEDLHEKWDSIVEQGQEEALTVSAKRLGIETDEELAHTRERQAAGRRAGWAALSAALLAAARQALYDPTPAATLGEAADAVVTPGIVRYALSVAGGSSPVRSTAGGVKDAVTGGFAGGVATGDDVAALWGSYGQPWEGYEWVYNYAGPSPFFDHEVLGVSGPDGGGIQFSSWDDPALSTSGTDSEWLGEFFFPGDHFGCECDAVPLVPGDLSG